MTKDLSTMVCGNVQDEPEGKKIQHGERDVI